MKRRKEQPEKLKQKNTETGSDWRELLQMEMPQVFGKSITEQHLLMNMIPKNQKNLTFTYVLRYSGDVSLELRYTLLNGTQTAIRCANGQNKTAQTVYSDEVTDGDLAYTLALTGGDAASGVEISDVSCYQSGSGRNKGNTANRK